MTTWSCIACGTEAVHGSTAVPLICKPCAARLDVCPACVVSDMQDRIAQLVAEATATLSAHLDFCEQAYRNSCAYADQIAALKAAARKVLANNVSAEKLRALEALVAK